MDGFVVQGEHATIRVEPETAIVFVPQMASEWRIYSGENYNYLAISRAMSGPPIYGIERNKYLNDVVDAHRELVVHVAYQIVAHTLYNIEADTYQREPHSVLATLVCDETLAVRIARLIADRLAVHYSRLYRPHAARGDIDEPVVCEIGGDQHTILLRQRCIASCENRRARAIVVDDLEDAAVANVGCEITSIAMSRNGETFATLFPSSHDPLSFAGRVAHLIADETNIFTDNTSRIEASV